MASIHQRILFSSRKTQSILNLSLRDSIARLSGPLQGSEQRQRSYAIGPSLPRVAQPSLWQSIIPKFMRRSHQAQSLEKARPSREWNPATFFIVTFLLIGSNAMQMIALRNDFTTFSRRADAKIGLLKEVIERVQKGEDVDVKGLLGTGDPEQEKEWELVIQEVEEEDRLWQAKARRRQQKKALKEAEATKGKDVHDSTPLPAGDTTKSSATDAEGETRSPIHKAPRGFY